ncbi:Hypothetical predicted protein [Mytilus galloprovincialis]|uniref:Uncharacterized protein n=2 Tax=Mytilus galloprovincialis TaxID=29158 RepID=A0A8B6CDX1_MYTGA|nr:Hypothetical predicted protein [Mytilus galloprovincialis]
MHLSRRTLFKYILFAFAFYDAQANAKSKNTSNGKMITRSALENIDGIGIQASNFHELYKSFVYDEMFSKGIKFRMMRYLISEQLKSLKLVGNSKSKGIKITMTDEKGNTLNSQNLTATERLESGENTYTIISGVVETINMANAATQQSEDIDHLQSNDKRPPSSKHGKHKRSLRSLFSFRSRLIGTGRRVSFRKDLFGVSWPVVYKMSHRRRKYVPSVSALTSFQDSYGILDPLASNLIG